MSEICLSPKTCKRIAKYAKFSNMSVEDAADKIIDKWMEAKGDDIVRTLEQREQEAKAPAASRLKLVRRKAS